MGNECTTERKDDQQNNDIQNVEDNGPGLRKAYVKSS